MPKLPHVSGHKRGPKRIHKARAIAAAGRKNWHARASMWLDGLGSKRPRGINGTGMRFVERSAIGCLYGGNPL